MYRCERGPETLQLHLFRWRAEKNARTGWEATCPYHILPPEAQAPSPCCQDTLLPSQQWLCPTSEWNTSASCPALLPSALPGTIPQLGSGKRLQQTIFFFLDLSQKLFHIKETTDVWISKGSEFAQFGQALKHSQFYSSHPAQDLMAGGDFLVRFLVLQLSVLVGSIGICSYPYKLKTSLNISVLF